MISSDISPYITIKKVRTGEEIQIRQDQLQIRESQNGIMALSYKAHYSIQ